MAQSLSLSFAQTLLLAGLKIFTSLPFVTVHEARLIELFSIINLAQHSHKISQSNERCFPFCSVKGEQPEAMHAGFAGTKKSTNVLCSLSLILLLSQAISQR